MLSWRMAGTDPGRLAYATLPKHAISKHPFLPRQGSWPLLWSLEVRVPLPSLSRRSVALGRFHHQGEPVAVGTVEERHPEIVIGHTLDQVRLVVDSRASLAERE